MAFQRPSKMEVYRWLASRKGVIAHFSSVAKGEAEERTFNPHAYYPSDLKRVIEGRIEGSLPCSVVIPTDELDVRTGRERAVGSIGVVLGLKNEFSLVGAYPQDDGTLWSDSGPRECAPQPILTIPDLEKTITDRPDDQYNEWCIQDYEVLGLFIARPLFAWRVGAKGANPESLDTLRADFGDLTIYTFERPKGTIIRLENGVFVSAEHDELYRTPYGGT